VREFDVVNRLSRRINLELISLQLGGGEEGEYWANEILKGGYIIHMRHAKRNDSIDLNIYDYIDVNNTTTLTPEIRKLVCLNLEGLAQSQLLGFMLSEFDISVSKVYSSPSCRAYETLLFSDTEIDFDINVGLLYKTIFPLYSDISQLKILEDFFDSIEYDNYSNVLLVGHNGIPFDGIDIIFKDHTFRTSRLEGGVSILSYEPGRGITIHYTYVTLRDFYMALLKLTT